MSRRARGKTGHEQQQQHTTHLFLIHALEQEVAGDGGLDRVLLLSALGHDRHLLRVRQSDASAVPPVAGTEEAQQYLVGEAHGGDRL
jgi:hypothetical protein